MKTNNFDINYEKKAIRKMSIVGIGGNVLLVAFKFFAGFVGNSAAMVADAIHSLTDIVSTVVAYVGATIARKPADQKHQYGHERQESIAALVVGLILFATGFGIALDSVESIIDGTYNELETSTWIAIVAAIVSIIVKEAMFWYTMFYAKKLNSSVFKADAWHHRSDSLSSVGALVGIIGSMNGVKILEPIACIFIALMIFKVSFDVIRDGLSKIVDKSCGTKFQSEVENILKNTEGVIRVDSIKTRMFGEKIIIDAEICCDRNLPLYQAHAIAQLCHDKVEKKYPDVKHIMIHVNPD